MISYDNVRTVEVELSSFCNASCPLCSRNYYGYNPKDPGFTVKHLTLEEFQKIFSKDFLKKLNRILLQGNFGDFAMNPETPDIVDYIVSSAPNVSITGFTNGGVQSTSWWEKLTKMKIVFALDGATAEIHNLYRKDTNFEKVIENATAFRRAGGHAVWRMIKFDHNQHQVEQCKKMAQDLGFEFSVIPNTKTSGPVFDQKKVFLHNIGNWKGSKDLDHLMSQEILLEDIDNSQSGPAKFNCVSLQTSGIYIDSTGSVFPCCFMAHSPDTWGKSRWGEPANQQLRPLIHNNNSLVHGLESAIEWFKNIPPTWNLNSVNEGRLYYCEANCKQNDKSY